METPCAPSSELPGSSSSSRMQLRESAIRIIAKQCVYVIRGCLREEEWIDAEEEFVRIIAEAIALAEK